MSVLAEAAPARRGEGGRGGPFVAILELGTSTAPPALTLEATTPAAGAPVGGRGDAACRTHPSRRARRRAACASEAPAPKLPRPPRRRPNPPKSPSPARRPRRRWPPRRSCARTRSRSPRRPATRRRRGRWRSRASPMARPARSGSPARRRRRLAPGLRRRRLRRGRERRRGAGAGAGRSARSRAGSTGSESTRWRGRRWRAGRRRRSSATTRRAPPPRRGRGPARTPCAGGEMSVTLQPGYNLDFGADALWFGRALHPNLPRTNRGS